MRGVSFLFFVVFLVSVFVAPLSASAQEQTATISLLPVRGIYKVNDIFSVVVQLDAPASVTSLKAHVNYDSSRLRFLGMNTTGSVFSYWWENNSLAASSAGQVKLQASAPAPGITGANLHVATIQFQAIGNGLAAILLSPDSLVLTSADANILNASEPPGSIFSIGTVVPSVPSFSRDLELGSQGADVKALQQYLNSQGFTLAPAGPGSPGNETDYFGSLTTAALIRFQEAHAAQILHPVGLTAGSGYFGPSTRKYITNL